jgi:hypothetical protein
MTRRKAAVALLAAWSVTCCAAAQAAANQHPFPHEAAEAGRWSLIIALLALVLGLPVLLWLVGFVIYLARLSASKIRKPANPPRLSVPFVGSSMARSLGQISERQLRRLSPWRGRTPLLAAYSRS